MTIAIDYFHAQGARRDILGIHVAVDDLLKAWFRFGQQRPFICRPADGPSYEHFRQLAQDAGVAAAHCVGLDPRTPQHNLSGVACLFRPDPALAEMAWRRRQLAGAGYAACGLLHSLSGEQVSRTVSELALAPLDDADALICPSTAIRDAARNLWAMQAEDLDRRFGGDHRCAMQTPVIPLGIDANKFAARSTPEMRREQRERLGVAPDEIVILFVGRLSFATKAHPLPLLMAAEQAAQRTRRKLRLVLFGYFKPQEIMEPRFRALAADICKTAHCDFVTNDDPRFPDGLWAGADIFASLVDNVQESFGLTPLEAMACGLPVVATDWDGYRDGVRHGHDGFLIPTAMPPAEAGQAIADLYANENNYGAFLCGAAQSTALDIAAAAAAFATLAEDDALRRAMGQSGQRRAQSDYDWRAIIPAYESLWYELAARRQAGSRHASAGWHPISSGEQETNGTPAFAGVTTSGNHRSNNPERGAHENTACFHPAYPNPFAVFGGFASGVLDAEDRLQIVIADDAVAAILKHDMNFFIPELLMPQPLLREMIAAMRHGGDATIGDMLAQFSSAERPRLWRCLGWLLKHGVAVREAR